MFKAYYKSLKAFWYNKECVAAFKNYKGLQSSDLLEMNAILDREVERLIIYNKFSTFFKEEWSAAQYKAAYPGQAILLVGEGDRNPDLRGKK